MSKSYLIWQFDEDPRKKWRRMVFSKCFEWRKGKKRPRKSHGTKWARAWLMPNFYTRIPRWRPLKGRQWPYNGRWTLGSVLGLFSPLGINLNTCWHFPPYLTCFEPLWSKDSLILVLTVMRDRSNNDSNYRKLAFEQPRPHKSYTRVVYICVSRSSPLNVLNLIFKAQLARFKGWFSPDKQSLQQKNARVRS